MFDPRSVQTKVYKTGSDSSTAKRSATSVSARVLRDDHYKGLARVTVGIARLTAQWPCKSAEYRSKFVKICSSSKIKVTSPND